MPGGRAQSVNGFTIFAHDVRRRLLRERNQTEPIPWEELKNIASAEWINLHPTEQQQYKERAKEVKMKERTERHTRPGRAALDELCFVRDEISLLQEFGKKREMDITRLYQNWDWDCNRDEKKHREKKFVMISCQTYGQESGPSNGEETQHYPAEISIVEFSLNSGIHSQHHSILPFLAGNVFLPHPANQLVCIEDLLKAMVQWYDLNDQIDTDQFYDLYPIVVDKYDSWRSHLCDLHAVELIKGNVKDAQKMKYKCSVALAKGAATLVRRIMNKKKLQTMTEKPGCSMPWLECKDGNIVLPQMDVVRPSTSYNIPKEKKISARAPKWLHQVKAMTTSDESTDVIVLDTTDDTDSTTRHTPDLAEFVVEAEKRRLEEAAEMERQEADRNLARKHQSSVKLDELKFNGGNFKKEKVQELDLESQMKENDHEISNVVPVSDMAELLDLFPPVSTTETSTEENTHLADPSSDVQTVSYSNGLTVDEIVNLTHSDQNEQSNTQVSGPVTDVVVEVMPKFSSESHVVLADTNRELVHEKQPKAPKRLVGLGRGKLLADGMTWIDSGRNKRMSSGAIGGKSELLDYGRLSQRH